MNITIQQRLTVAKHLNELFLRDRNGLLDEPSKMRLLFALMQVL